MKWIVSMVAVIVLVGVVAAVMYREKVVERSIEIAAPPAQVWRVLTDFAAYPQWNPMVTRLEGELRVGGELRAHIVNNGSGMDLRPELLVADPERELRWLGRFVLPGLVDGEHYFLLEPTERGTRLVQGERFRGVLVPIAGQAIDVADAFEASNLALRQRVLATIAQ